MTARAEVAGALSRICARCDGPMVITRDAIGRERLRCRRCDGVSRIRPHPDDVLVPQGLVRANSLPPVAPGQLRRQRCAHGVEGDRRFCRPCERVRRSIGARARNAIGPRHYAPKPCASPDCGATFVPTGPRSLYCEGCR